MFDNFKNIESREKKKKRERELEQELELAKVYVDLHKRFRIIIPGVRLSQILFLSFPIFLLFLFVSYDFKRNIYITFQLKNILVPQKYRRLNIKCCR